jgi:antirestriction protein
MLADSPIPGAEEWAIHDYEDFEGASLSEYASFETVCALPSSSASMAALAPRSTVTMAMTSMRRSRPSRTMLGNTARR